MPCNAWNTAVRGMEEGRIQTILKGAGRTSDRGDKATNSSLGQDHEDSARDSRSRHRGRGNERKSPPARPGRTRPPGYRMSLHKVPVGARNESAYQHRGYGSRLIAEAERTAAEDYQRTKMVVISALGTKNYYSRFDYRHDGPYMSKRLN